jgi:hypothetical protein
MQNQPLTLTDNPHASVISKEISASFSEYMSK